MARVVCQDTWTHQLDGLVRDQLAPADIQHAQFRVGATEGVNADVRNLRGWMNGVDANPFAH